MSGSIPRPDSLKYVQGATGDLRDAASPQALVAWFSRSTLAWIATAATLNLALFEVVLGGWIARDRDLGGGTLLYVAAHVVLSGVLAAAAACVLHRILHGVMGPRVALAWGALAGGGFWFANRTLFDGAAISSHEHIDVIRPGFYAVGFLVLVIGMRWLGRWLTSERRRHTGGRRLAVAAVVVASGAVLQYADATQYTGGYPWIHVQVAIAAWLAHALAWTLVFSMLEDRVPTAHRPAVVLLAVFGIAALGTCIALRKADGIHTTRAAARNFAFAVTYKVHDPLERLIFERIAPLEEIEAEIPVELLERLWSPATTNPWLDAVVGSARARWNVVIIAADTLRHDATGFGGGSPSRTPNIDRLAAASLVFDRAYTPYPTSNYAYSSLMSGFYPRSSPARAAEAGRDIGLPPRPNLAEVLSEGGWNTVAVTAFNAQGIASPSFFQPVTPGFGVFNPTGNVGELVAEEVTDSALKEIDARAGSKPFFLWAHYMDPHTPYSVHDDFDYGKGTRAGYESEIAYMDHHVGRLLDRLEAPDLVQDTVVIFLSDHGEAFGEHNTAFHNSSLYEEQIRIPLTWRIPGVESRRLGTVANLVDVAPTLLGLLGIVDGIERNGRDMCGVLFERPEAADWIGISYSERFPRDFGGVRRMQRSLYHDGLKLIRYTNDPSLEIYDLEADPGELSNIADGNEPRHRRLIGLMKGIDAKIDGRLLPEAAGPDWGARADDVLRRFASEKPQDRGLAIGLMMQLLLGPRFEYRPGIVDAVGRDKVEKMVAGGIAYWHEMADPAKALQRNFALTILAEIPFESLREFMLARFAESDPTARTLAALWLVRSGDERGRAVLEASLALDVGEWSLRIAPPLAHIGSRAGEPWLELALNSRNVGELQRAIRALTALKTPGLARRLREHMSLLAGHWQVDEVTAALRDAAVATDTDDANLLLLELAHSPFTFARTTARDALVSRFDEERLATALAAVEHQVRGDSMMRDGDYPNAVTQYEEAARLGAGLLSDELLGLKHARALAMRGDTAGARRILDRLVTAPSTGGRTRSHARALRSTLEGDGRLLHLPRETDVGVEIVGNPGIPNIIGVKFKTRVRLRWDGPRTLPGGIWDYGLRLAYIWRDAKTGEIWEPRLKRITHTFLPGSGIAPGGSVEVDVLGVTPPLRGKYEPLLILSCRPWVAEEQRTLKAFPPVNLVRLGERPRKD